MIFILSLVLMFTLFVNLYSKSKKITFLKNTLLFINSNINFMVLIIFLTVVLISGFFFIEYLANSGYLNSKQYRIYFIVLFVLGLFLCGILENYCNTPNGF